MQRGLPQSRQKMQTELDKLLNLPSELLGEILSLLPTRDVVRTSVLSSKWRFIWAMLPCLLFDEESVSRTGNSNRFGKIVHRVLLLHIGPVYTFKVWHSDLLGTELAEDIDSWILHLSRNDIKHFCLWFSGQPKYKLPSSLFSCQDMITLELGKCSLKLPSFMGFKTLERLRLSCVTLSRDDFENLIGCCPRLKTLRLGRCPGLTHIKINSPSLQRFRLRGVFESLILENSFKLTDVVLLLEKNIDQRLIQDSSSNLIKFFVQLPHLHDLRISNYFLKYLACGACPRELPTLSLKLVTLDLCISLNDQDEILTTLCILRSSPALKWLNILICLVEPTAVGDVNFGLDDGQNCRLTQLRFVKITGISGIKVEIDFIRLLLSASPMLEKMTINPASSVNDASELLQKLIQLKRASAEAVIIFSD